MIDIENCVPLLSTELRNFKQVKPGYYNFSCNICGDSTKIKYKARAYIYNYQGKYWFKCFNCGYSCTLENYIKKYFSDIYNNFRISTFSNFNTKLNNINLVFNNNTENIKNKLTNNILDRYATNISTLSENHLAKEYVIRRKIPTNKLNLLYYTDNFLELVKSLGITNKKVPEDKRLLLPFFNKKNILTAIQARSLLPGKEDKMRYITIRLEDENIVFGANRINETKPIYVVEGPIDSLFIDNCVAVACSSLEQISKRLPEIDKDNFILLYDNEPRNKEICNNMQKAISQGYKICIWPEDLHEKDINDMILANIDIKTIIANNIYYGLEANLRFNKFRKFF